MTKVKEENYMSTSLKNGHPNWKSTVSNVTASLYYHPCARTFKYNIV